MEMPAASVTAVEAISRDVPVYLDEIGRCISPEMVMVRPQVAGRITEIAFAEGAEVKKGDPLITIDPRPFKAELAKAQATLAQNKAELDRAKVEWDRIEKLRGSNAVSEEEQDQKRLAVEVAKAQIDAAQALVDTAQLNLEYCTIKAPLTGRTGAHWVDVGNVVKENDTTLATIQQLDPIEAEFTITENDLGTVRKYIAGSGRAFGRNPEQGLKVLVDVPGDSQAVLAALGQPRPAASQPASQPTTTASAAPTTQPRYDASPREGTLIFLDNAVQDQTGTVKLRARLKNSDNYFWPGQFVNVRLVLTTKKDAVLVPAQAQQIGQQGPYVYVVKDGKVENPVTKQAEAATIAEIRPITPGQRQGELLVVESGVEKGEMVIVTGQMGVTPMGKVKVVNAAPAAPGAQATAGE